MFRAALAISLLAPAPATCQGLVADAFGLVPESFLTEERANWAGYRLRTEGPEILFPGAIDSVAIFVGPKSLVAGRDRGHAVALGTDRHGNLSADNLEAEFFLGSGRHSATTRNGIADVVFLPTTVAGGYVAGAAFGTRQSPRASFRVTADSANLGPVEITLPETVTPETVVRLISGPLTDRFGNFPEDGTAATITASETSGAANFLYAPVIDGHARGHLLLRDTGARLAISTTLAADTAAGGVLVPQAVAYAGPVEATYWPIPELEALGLQIGPLATSSGHLLSDGAPLRAVLSTGNGVEHVLGGWLRDGFFETMIPLDHEIGPLSLQVTTSLGTVGAVLHEAVASRRFEVPK